MRVYACVCAYAWHACVSVEARGFLLCLPQEPTACTDEVGLGSQLAQGLLCLHLPSAEITSWLLRPVEFLTALYVGSEDRNWVCMVLQQVPFCTEPLRYLFLWLVSF